MKKCGLFDVAGVLRVGALLLVLVASVVPLLVVAQAESKTRSNAQKAAGTLRTLVTQENMWHKQDVDGNGVNDYWVADVAGMYRVIRQPAGTEAKMIDIAVARSDWSPDGSGDGGGGEFPLLAIAYAAGTQVPGLAAMAHTAPVPNSGYYVAAFRNDAAGRPYACDMDGAGQAYENTRKLAFMAFPDTYEGTGKNAYIVDATGVIWRIDAATGNYSLANGPVNAALPPDGTCPVTNWPHANPAATGYAQEDWPDESGEEENADGDDELNPVLLKKGTDCPICGKELDFSVDLYDTVCAFRRLENILKPRFEGARDKTPDRDCANNLKQLGLYIVLWVSKFGKETTYPGPGMKLLFELFNHPNQKESIVAGAYSLLVCRRAKTKRPTAESVAACDPDCSSYDCTKDQLKDSHPPGKPIVWDKKPVHDGKRNVLLFDGSVREFSEEEFKKALQKYEGKK
jgi:prepilin-type processing-associated H-X9-DG protein